jgi:hypothetical protein
VKSRIRTFTGHLIESTPHSLCLTIDPRTLTLIRASVLASSVILMLAGAWGHSVTVVEFAHLPAGLASWQRHSLGIYRVCGPLSKFLLALPAHMAGITVDYPRAFDFDHRDRKEWELARLFQIQNCERYHNIYRWSRLTCMLITLFGALLICEWSTRVFGPWPGLVSLCVWCWMPPVLAHGSLVTSDMLSAVMLVLAARSFWAYLLKPGFFTMTLAGLTLGLAQATKFSLLILYPCWFLFLVIRAIQVLNGCLRNSCCNHFLIIRMIIYGIAIFPLSFVVINALYLFQNVGFSLAEWQDGRSALWSIVISLVKKLQVPWLLEFRIPIAVEFVRGLDFQLGDTERLQSSYLLGNTEVGGWWYWYAAAASMKIPIPVLALCLMSIVRSYAICDKNEEVLWAILCILVPAIEIAIVISNTTGTGTNAAFRYLLPSIALLCVWFGHAWRQKFRAANAIIIGLLAWLAINALYAAPDYIAWRNEVTSTWERWSGRPALIGDSLDWGQDLARLKKWLSLNKIDNCLFLCAYGIGDSMPYGLSTPVVRSSSNAGPCCAYLAVSEECLYNLNDPSYISVCGNIAPSRGSVGQFGFIGLPTWMGGSCLGSKRPISCIFKVEREIGRVSAYFYDRWADFVGLRPSAGPAIPSTVS